MTFSPDRMRGPNMKVRNALRISVVLAGVTVFVYRFGLSERARESLREGARSVSDAVESVVEKIEDMAGIVVDEGPLHNREETERDWEALGY